MTDRILNLRELNRATLHRQMLLERSAGSVTVSIEHLVGLQAQLASAPYVGLWSRLRAFGRDDLADLIRGRTIVKAPMMRATLHLVSASDFLRFRSTLQPVLSQASESIVARLGAALDMDEILESARAFIAEEPRTFKEISVMLAAMKPGAELGAMRYTVRTHLPLVQVPVSGGWGFPGNPKFALAESWLGEAISQEEEFGSLVLRYLAAFGPATVTDLQTWLGKGGLKEAVDKLKPELVTYRDETKRELLDLPDMPLPGGDSSAPVRFLPEYDNLLLSHQKRTRVLADEYRSRVYLPGLRVAATFLVDGFVRGVWKVEKVKGTATLVLEPFTPLGPADRTALEEEGERLVHFVEESAKRYEVRFDI